MSLKVFHLVFIVLAILMAIGCALWAFLNETAFVFGIGSSVTAVALMVYGIWFLKKSQKIIT